MGQSLKTLMFRQRALDECIQLVRVWMLAVEAELSGQRAGRIAAGLE
jgi:hypothetical protein